MPDRLVLSGDASPAGEATLRLATDLAGWREKTSDALEAQREILRLEYRMLTVLAEQATTQLAAADKLRTMEETLAALRSRTDDLTSRMEKGAPVAQSAPPPAAPQPPVATPANVAPPEEKSSFLSEWSFYGALLGAVFGIGGWLGWQQYRQRRELRLEPSFADLEPVTEPTIETPPPASPEVDLDVGAAVPEEPWRVDMPMEYLERPDADITVVEDHGHFAETEAAQDEAETDEEVPEANPVMELAEIMLSFGRVKGAAQALQEYIDQNPEEALKPWIRLMDVYRMAGMREDFERLARDLNQHFNVEIQQWERASQEMMAPLAAFDLVLVPQGEELPVASAESARKGLELEDFDHIRQRLTELWGSDDCTEYLDHLLRDNRGGQRNGFALPVVEDILFLMELHQTRNSLDKQTMDGEKNE